jgi:hypothetical protein
MIYAVHGYRCREHVSRAVVCGSDWGRHPDELQEMLGGAQVGKFGEIGGSAGCIYGGLKGVRALDFGVWIWRGRGKGKGREGRVQKGSFNVVAMVSF